MPVVGRRLTVDGVTINSTRKELLRMAKSVPSWVIVPRDGCQESVNQLESPDEVFVSSDCDFVSKYKKFTWGKRRMWAMKAVYCAFHGSMPPSSRVIHCRMETTPEGCAMECVPLPPDKVCVNPDHLACVFSLPCPGVKKEAFLELLSAGLSVKGARQAVNMSISYAAKCAKVNRSLSSLPPAFLQALEAQIT